MDKFEKKHFPDQDESDDTWNGRFDWEKLYLKEFGTLKGDITTSVDWKEADKEINDYATNTNIGKDSRLIVHTRNNNSKLPIYVDDAIANASGIPESIIGRQNSYRDTSNFIWSLSKRSWMFGDVVKYLTT